MTPLFTLEASNICFIFLDLFFILLTLLSFILQVSTIVGTRPVARDCTVARGIAHAIISRPEVPTENNAQDEREQDYTDGHHNKGPYGHDPYVTTIGKLAHDQHDRPTKTTNDRP